MSSLDSIDSEFQYNPTLPMDQILLSSCYHCKKCFDRHNNETQSYIDSNNNLHCSLDCMRRTNNIALNKKRKKLYDLSDVIFVKKQKERSSSTTKNDDNKCCEETCRKDLSNNIHKTKNNERFCSKNCMSKFVFKRYNSKVKHVELFLKLEEMKRSVNIAF
jgi:hypothetical protein